MFLAAAQCVESLRPIFSYNLNLNTYKLNTNMRSDNKSLFVALIASFAHFKNGIVSYDKLILLLYPLNKKTNKCISIIVSVPSDSFV